jgi:DNA-binding NarL/FixJ family response regulator
MSTVRVLLADDHALVRSGLRGILDAHADIEVVGEAEDGGRAADLALELRPDVVLMDVRMPRVDGIEATRRITAHAGAPKVLVLTTFDLDEHVHEALRAGASGFMLKDAPPGQLAEGVRQIARGEMLLAPAITRRLVERFVPRAEPDPALGELTAREHEVLLLIARGLSNAEIGGELHLSETTVKTHVGRVLQKLALRDRVQAVIYAYERGLV